MPCLPSPARVPRLPSRTPLFARAGNRLLQAMLTGCVPVIVQVVGKAGRCLVQSIGRLPRACGAWRGSAFDLLLSCWQRLIDQVLSPCSLGCPVMQEHVFSPYEDVLPYELFSIR